MVRKEASQNSRVTHLADNSRKKEGGRTRGRVDIPTQGALPYVATVILSVVAAFGYVLHDAGSISGAPRVLSLFTATSRASSYPRRIVAVRLAFSWRRDVSFCAGLAEQQDTAKAVGNRKELRGGQSGKHKAGTDTEVD